MELVKGLDYNKFYVLNGKVFYENKDLSELDVYFWHDTVKPRNWNGDNYYMNALGVLENNCKVINPSESVRITNDKFLSPKYQFLVLFPLENEFSVQSIPFF